MKECSDWRNLKCSHLRFIQGENLTNHLRFIQGENLTKSKEIVRYFPFLKSFSFFVGGYLEYHGGCSVLWGIS